MSPELGDRRCVELVDFFPQPQWAVLSLEQEALVSQAVLDLAIRRAFCRLKLASQVRGLET